MHFQGEPFTFGLEPAGFEGFALKDDLGLSAEARALERGEIGEHPFVALQIFVACAFEAFVERGVDQNAVPVRGGEEAPTQLL